MEISPRKVAQVAMMARELGRAEGEMRAFIDRMSEDEQAELVAIMWIGRESFEADDLEEAIATAKAEAVNKTSQYLLGVPLLADYLEAGLEALGIDPEEEEDDLY